MQDSCSARYNLTKFLFPAAILSQTKKRLQLPKRHNGNPGIVGQATGIEQLADAPSAQFATTTFKLYDF